MSLEYLRRIEVPTPASCPMIMLITYVYETYPKFQMAWLLIALKLRLLSPGWREISSKIRSDKVFTYPCPLTL